MSKKDFKSTFLNIQNEEPENIIEPKVIKEEITVENQEVKSNVINIDSNKKKAELKNVDNKISKNKPKSNIKKAVPKNNTMEKAKSKETIVIVSEGNNKDSSVLVTTEIQVASQTINEKIQQRVIEIEKEIKKLKTVGFGTGKSKVSFDDMYGGKTISMNRYLKPLFDEICNTSSITRAEITEKILINGIKNTNFNPPKNDE